MPLTIAQKLKIKEANTLLVFNKPSDFVECLGSLPANVSIATKPNNYTQIHWFVKDKLHMEKPKKSIVQLIVLPNIK